ncbi:hypothetical protein AALP_AA8G250200 [Arabis alpina]|uniref:Uncharacterized protein n=1 Tax=Arabis alpina TaxID=50452 RepID=A0A087G9A0_ARAAL|nr:hypothetical protein AALP_AA8G250200 [Arabis alpina]
MVGKKRSDLRGGVGSEREGRGGHGRKPTTGGGGVNRIDDRGKQTADSGGGVKQSGSRSVKNTGGPSGGVKQTGGGGVKQTCGGGVKQIGGGGKRIGVKVTPGGDSTSKAPPPHNSREGTSRDSGL